MSAAGSDARSQPPDLSTDPQGATAAQLRHDINSGLTGDKIAGFDPAASPLGTDEEAAGTPLDPQLVAQVRATEQSGRPRSATSNAATPELQPNGALNRGTAVGRPVLIGVAIALAMAVLLYVLLV